MLNQACKILGLVGYAPFLGEIMVISCVCVVRVWGCVCGCGCVCVRKQGWIAVVSLETAVFYIIFCYVLRLMLGT